MIKVTEVTEDEFPIATKQYVDCRFPRTRKGKLLDAGSCKIPVNRTITLSQYRKQQTEGVQIASRC